MSTLRNADFRPLSRRQYFADLTARLARFGRGDSAVLVAMTFDPRPAELTGLLDNLEAAARRGARVRLLCDAITFMVTEDGALGPLFWSGSIKPDRLRGRFKTIYATLERLRQAGAEVTLTNRPGRPFSLPIAGRSHLKFAVLNDTVYLGGSNLDFPTHSDFMVRWTDPATASWLDGLTADIARVETILGGLGDIDLRHELDTKTTAFLDVGRRGQSIILDQAIELINQAREHIYLTTQYFPSAGTARHLRRALDRGVRLHIVYNNVANAHFSRPLHYGNFWLQKRRLPADFFRHELPRSAPYLHAKILATEQAVLFGSHNYVTPGVKLGTAEIALLRRDPSFASHLQDWFERFLKSV